MIQYPFYLQFVYLKSVFFLISLKVPVVAMLHWIALLVEELKKY